jgi:preprotein translocase subunit SecF
MQIKFPQQIKFVNVRHIAYALSISMIILGIIGIATRGLNFGIDFTGGYLFHVQFSKEVEIAELRQVLESHGIVKPSIQALGQDQSGYPVIIRVKGHEIDRQSLEESVKVAFEELSEYKPVIKKIEMVGPAISKHLFKQTLLAFSIAFLVIIAYVGWRFGGGMWGVGGVIALVHDVAITLGFCAWTRTEISVVTTAAFLTLAGYSVNDTIVVYDRIRENLRRMYKSPLLDIFNYSITGTLSRTLITSVTTLLVVLVLFISGGEVVHDFAFVLLIGICIGTYSSVFVASPICYDFYSRRKFGQRKFH